MLGKVKLSWISPLLLTGFLLGASISATGAAIPHLVRDIVPGNGSCVDANNFAMVCNGRVVIFRGYGSSYGNLHLWASDGTEAGTIALTPLASSSSMLAVDRKGRAYFDNNSNEIWISDGAVTGTRPLFRLTSTVPVKIPCTMVADNGLYFAADAGGYGALGYSNGTSAWIVKAYGSIPGYMAPWGRVELVACLGQILYFTVTSATGLELWRSDGSTAGTVRIYQFGMNVMGVPPYVAFIGNMMYFTETITSTHSALWKTDGTPGGTVLVSDDLNVPLYFPTTFRNQIFFLGYSQSNSKLYRSDGTARGTVSIASASGFPTYACATSTTLYYATTGCFWRSDGYTFQSIGNLAFVSGLHRGILQIPGQERWILSAQGANHLGQELWESDGTSAGTQMIQDIHGGSGSSNPDDFTLCGEQVFFTAQDAVHGRELWVLPLYEALCAAREWREYR